MHPRLLILILADAEIALVMQRARITVSLAYRRALEEATVLAAFAAPTARRMDVVKPPA